MAKGVERLVGGDLLVGGVDGAYFIDGENLHGVGPAHIRGHGVLILAQIQLDRFGDLGKKIHHRRASQAEGLLRELKLQPLDAAIAFHLGDEEDDFDRILEAGRGDRSPDPVRSTKKNFSGKAKYSISSRWPAKEEGA